MIITVGNTKGGVGKSTISVNLAVESSRKGKKTLLIDTDPQGSAMAFRGERDTDDISAIALITEKLHKDNQGFRESFDVIIIDAGGRDNKVFRSAVAACQFFLLPVLPSQFDVWAAEDSLKVFQEIQPFNDMTGSIVLNMVRPNTIVSKEAQEALAEYESDIPLLAETLHNRVAYKTSISQGLGVSEYEPRGKAASEIQALFARIFNHASDHA